MCGCESWAIKKAEHWRIDAFEQWLWRRLLRAPWMARRSNQSILKEISPEYTLEGLILKLKLQYFGHLMQRANSLAKTLMLRKIEGMRRRGQKRIRWLDGISNLIDMSLSKFQELVIDSETWCAVVHGVTKSQTWLSDWTELRISCLNFPNILLIQEWQMLNLCCLPPSLLSFLIRMTSLLFHYCRLSCWVHMLSWSPSQSSTP